MRVASCGLRSVDHKKDLERASNLSEILYDARWIGNHGIGRFASELQKLLPGLVAFEARRPPFHPLDPVLLGAALWRRNPKLFFSPGYNSPLGWPGAFVFTLHDLNHLRVPENSNALKLAYYRHIIKPACRRAQCVLTVSEYSKREIAAWAGLKEERIVNVGNGVGPAFSPTGPKYDPGYPYVLYVGSRKKHKNLFRLLKAYSISGVQRDVRLIFSGLPDQQLVGQINRLGLADYVIFKNLSSDGPLSEAYRGAVAFLFPSLYEGFGLPPLEAMACGVPVLTSNVCSLPEVVGDAATLVDPTDVQEIADGIRLLVQDSALRARLRDKGLLQARIFSWDETAHRTICALQPFMLSTHQAEERPKVEF
jgi:glycosyltransferase involved in cell wall biosynthesis